MFHNLILCVEPYFNRRLSQAVFFLCFPKLWTKRCLLAIPFFARRKKAFEKFAWESRICLLHWGPRAESCKCGPPKLFLRNTWEISNTDWNNSSQLAYVYYPGLYCSNSGSEKSRWAKFFLLAVWLCRMPDEQPLASKELKWNRGKVTPAICPCERTACVCLCRLSDSVPQITGIYPCVIWATHDSFCCFGTFPTGLCFPAEEAHCIEWNEQRTQRPRDISWLCSCNLCSSFALADVLFLSLAVSRPQAEGNSQPGSKVMGEAFLSGSLLVTDRGKREERDSVYIRMLGVSSENHKAHPLNPGKAYTHSNNNEPVVGEKCCENTCPQRQNPVIETSLKPHGSAQPTA